MSEKIVVDANGYLHENIEASSGLEDVNKNFLANSNPFEIAKVFSEFSRDKRVLVVPVGFPQAGKSLFLSSLMYYARNYADNVIKTNFENNNQFQRGRLVVDQMIEYFHNGKLFEANRKGSLDLIGLTITPTKKDYPALKLGFLDLAGEDIKSIKTSENGDFTDKINAVFNGLKVDDSQVVFVLITPFAPPKINNETSDSAHNREDTLHYDFLNYIKQDQPQLLKNTRFFVIVSQWDLNTDQDMQVEDYIRDFRPSVYSYVKNANVVWGEYSIGKILVSKVKNKDGQEVNMQEIVRKNFDYPSRFWKKLYHICTNKDLDQKKWWEKLLG